MQRQLPSHLYADCHINPDRDGDTDGASTLQELGIRQQALAGSSPGRRRRPGDSRRVSSFKRMLGSVNAAKGSDTSSAFSSISPKGTKKAALVKSSSQLGADGTLRGTTTETFQGALGEQAINRSWLAQRAR